MGEFKWVSHVKTKDDCLKDKPILTDDGRLLTKLDGKVYEIKINEKGDCKYYETNISNL